MAIQKIFYIFVNFTVTDKKEVVGVVSYDAGGAEIISSYIVRNKIKALYCLQGPAVNIFNGKIHKIEILSLDDLINKSDWLLCGTSWQSDLEWKAIQRAKKANKKVISFIDHWVNYRERYFKKSEYALPDEIWIGDIYAEKIAKDNFPNLKVMLKSNPYFLDMKEQLLKLKKSKNINILLNKVLYVCEPIREHAFLQHGDENYWGYTEEKALRYFLTNINCIYDKNVSIVIRPHPSEDIDKYNWVFNEFNQDSISIDNNKMLMEQIVDSDIVVGCESMAMVVALLAEKTVICSIPVGGRACVLPHKEIVSIEDYL